MQRRREFGFEDLAREYVGREPTPVEAAGVLIKLHAAPMYFYRRGKGRFQAAPEDTLKLALAAVEKKKREQEQVAAWAEALARGECPPEIAALQDELLYAPDRNKPQTKALEQACAQTGLTPAKLFARCGRLADSHDFHLKRFLHEFFPGGAAFPAHEVPALPGGLPRAPVAAFSLDDIGTTEIDDAFSVQRLAATALRVGIHIAAPALGFAPGFAARRDCPRAPVDRVHAGAQVHHAAGRRDRSLLARPRRRAAGCVALLGYRRADGGARAPQPARARADRRQPAPRAVRRAQRGVRERRDRGLPHEERAAHAVARRRLALEAKRGRPSARRLARLHLHRRERPGAHRAAQARRAARQAGRRR